MSRRLTSEGGYRLRHVHPTARLPSEGATTTVLGRSFGFTELPISGLPGGEDLVEGGQTGRLGDAGEFTLSFPNAAGSKGLWRERFNPDRALEFIEIYGPDDELEFVGSIARLEIDRGVVTISGPDAWALLRRAYERDRTWTAAPQEVLNAYTRVPVPLVADDFDGGSLDGAWTVEGTGTSAAVSGGKVRITTSSGVSAPGIRQSVSLPVGSAWRVTALFSHVSSANGAVAIDMQTSGGSSLATLTWADPFIQRLFSTSTGGQVSNPLATTLPQTLPVTLSIDCDGRWIRGFINGQMIGILPADTSNAIGRIKVTARGNSAAAGTADIEFVRLVQMTPFLARGSDLGEYVLPGDYPTGGLRGRYFNNADLIGAAGSVRLARTMAPDRESYAERLDPGINTGAGLAVPQPGSDGTYFAARWFGAVYLDLDSGDTDFRLTSVNGSVRVWVAKTAFGDQIIDHWSGLSGTSSTGTADASDLGGVSGWYPIVIEYDVATGGMGLVLQFRAAAGYTDPGGTSISGATWTTIPATSLSPLGCFDGRIQGQSHFDVVQQVAAQYGYQMRCEPMSLESGEFPGRLVPRERVGRDTDVALTVEEDEHGDPILSPGTTIDSSDQTLLLIGSGSGIADGRGSQVTAEIADLASLDAALFTLEGVVDAGDISEAALLEARLNAELALRASPWEEVRGTPLAQDRLADTWPLSDALSAMRWEPGDGVRLVLPDISVEDAEPRQLLQVTRAFNGLGRTGTQVAFRQRPRSAARSLRGLVRASLTSRRSYQGQIVTLTGDFVESTIGAGAFTSYSRVALFPSDRVVRAYVRVVLNTTPQSIGIEINTVDRTTELGGGWTAVPVDIDVTAYAAQNSTTDNRLFVRFENNGGSSTAVIFQLVVEVLR